MNMPRILKRLILILKPSVSLTNTRSIVNGGLMPGVKWVEKIL